MRLSNLNHKKRKILDDLIHVLDIKKPKGEQMKINLSRNLRSEINRDRKGKGDQRRQGPSNRPMGGILALLW